MIRSLATVCRFVARRLIVGTVNVLAVPPGCALLQRVRCLLLRAIGTRIGAGTEVSEHLYIYDGRNLRIGEDARLGSFCRVWDFAPIEIGDNFLASHGLTLISGTHELDEKRTDRPGPILIGNNVWIGINVTIVGPAKIADGVVIGANSLVMGDLASETVYAGTPARFIRKLDYT